MATDPTASTQRLGNYRYNGTAHDQEDSDSDRYDAAASLRSSAESTRLDHGILQEEEEQEKLLIAGRSCKTPRKGLLERLQRPATDSEAVKTGLKPSNSNERIYQNATKRIVYDIEEGGARSRTPSTDGASESGLTSEKTARNARKKSRPKRLFKFTAIHALIAVLFCAIAYGAYKASSSRRKKDISNELKSNGTSLFAPTTIFISLDGFRADFLQRGITPALNSLVKEGVSPKYMNPSFPSVTFPNHYTLVTGLHPESHGIVGNSFWAPDIQDSFFYTDFAHSMQPEWWLGEPIWVTAEDQGIRTAVHMWPGSEAHIGDIEPTHLDKYNGSEVLSIKVDRILELLDKPGPQDITASIEDPRPQLIAAYVPDVDADGHLYGPNSTEIRATIQDADMMIGLLLEALHQRNLTDIVNVVVVSDHGMATTSTARTIQLEDLIDIDTIEHIDGWPHYGLWPRNNDIAGLHSKLQETAGDHPGFDIYLRQSMPERYHFSNSDRIAPVWLITRTGWAIVTHEDFNVKAAQSNGDVYHPRGLHGYDHEDPLMRAIFVARGPAFPHKPNSRVESFQNIEVYNIICDSVNVVPKSNNGTLRLPLKPVGVHDDVKDPAEEVHDPPKSAISAAASHTSSLQIGSSSSPTAPVPTRPVVQHGNSTLNDTKEAKEKAKAAWLIWATEQLKALKAWTSEWLHHKAEQSAKATTFPMPSPN